jgi:hypothetical protein
MREALRSVICPTCGGPPVADDYFDEQKLRMENARLKEEASRFAFTVALAPRHWCICTALSFHTRVSCGMGSLTGCPA